MATSVEVIQDWLNNQAPEHGIAVDDGGLTLVILDEKNEIIDEYEIGGIPEDD